jgi:hypothetical protein
MERNSSPRRSSLYLCTENLQQVFNILCWNQIAGNVCNIIPAWINNLVPLQTSTQIRSWDVMTRAKNRQSPPHYVRLSPSHSLSQANKLISRNAVDRLTGFKQVPSIKRCINREKLLENLETSKVVDKKFALWNKQMALCYWLKKKRCYSVWLID